MHISIAGRLGSGKSTVCRVLGERHGFQVYSTGAIQREIAKERDVSTLEMNQLMANDISLDHAIDEATTRLSLEKADTPILFDSRMAWNFAVNSFKVFVTVDPLEAAIRVVGDRRGKEEVYADVEEAKWKLIARGKLENQRFQDIYDVDNLDYSNYNLVIDATYATPEMLADVIFEKYQAYCQQGDTTPEILLDPRSLFPLEHIGRIDADTASFPIPVVAFEGYHYIADGHLTVLGAVLHGEPFIDAALVGMETEALHAKLHGLGLSGIHEFEQLGQFHYKSYPQWYFV
ncbi:MAG: cytidylate kinase family protein [Oscillospiraceae bacterium]|nr:cytidylate kinase family protein [Oscillospiraceae bacterium]